MVLLNFFLGSQLCDLFEIAMQNCKCLLNLAGIAGNVKICAQLPELDHKVD